MSYAIKESYPNFIHLSIDGIILDKHGLYEVDYPPELYGQHQDEADTIFMDRYLYGLTHSQDLILDRSFYSRSYRQTYAQLAETHGARVVLLYFRPNNKECLWRRIRDRQAKRADLPRERQGDAAYTISREVFEGYWNGFDVPVDEGEVVLDM